MTTARRTHRPTIVLVLACALLACTASSAIAAPGQDLRSPDARDAAGTTSTPPQDLRSPDARDAAGTTRPLPGPPTWPAHPQPISSSPAVQASDGGSGIDWMPIALGIAGCLVAITGVTAVTARSRRLQRRRVAA